MKERFRSDGADSLRDHELLELLLYYAIPRADTNELAHSLMERFCTLRGVLEAPVEALASVPNVGDNTATLLKAVAAVHHRVRLESTEEERTLNTSADAAAFLAPRFLSADCECVYLLCLDGRKRVTCCELVARGEPTQVEISVREVVALALRNGAQGVILSHNHPDAPAIPSREDECVTLQIRDALSTIGVTLVDHVVFSDSEYVSMADCGILNNMRSPYRVNLL